MENKIVKRLVLIFTLILCPSYSMAAVQYHSAKISRIALGDSQITVSFIEPRFVGDAAGCINTVKYKKWVLLLSHPNYQAIYSGILSSKLANVRVNVASKRVEDCHAGYTIINGLELLAS